MWNWAKPNLSDLGNDLSSDSIKYFSSQFIVAILWKLHAKIEKVTDQFFEKMVKVQNWRNFDL